MKFFTTSLMLLVTLVAVSDCRKRGLSLHPEEMVNEAATDDDTEDPVIVDRGRGSPGKADSVIPVITDQNANANDKGRVIYPTEASVTTTRATKESVNNVAEDKTKIPESLLIAMKNVNSADEFYKHFVAKDPDDDDIFNSSSVFGLFDTAKPGINNRKGLSSAGATTIQITAFARCQPQKTVVKVDNPAGGGVLLWPPCVYLLRCGGCCTSELMTCSPTATSTVNITVLQARYSGPQSNPFTNEGVRQVTMEQHDSCACDCKELAEHCTPLQEYRKNECRCVCANQNEAISCQQRSNKFWDSHDCVCKCRNTSECSSGLFFNIKTCRCELLRFSLAARPDALPRDRKETKEAQDENESSAAAAEN